MYYERKAARWDEGRDYSRYGMISDGGGYRDNCGQYPEVIYPINYEEINNAN